MKAIPLVIIAVGLTACAVLLWFAGAAPTVSERDSVGGAEPEETQRLVTEDASETIASGRAAVAADPRVAANPPTDAVIRRPGDRMQVKVNVLLERGLAVDDIHLKLMSSAHEPFLLDVRADTDSIMRFGTRPRASQLGLEEFRALVPEGAYWLEARLSDTGTLLGRIDGIVVDRELAPDPRLQRFDLRGLLRKIEVELQIPGGVLSLPDQLRADVEALLPNGEVVEDLRVRRSKLEFLCAHGFADIRIEVPGYEPVELREVSGKRRVMLQPVAIEPR